MKYEACNIPSGVLKVASARYGFDPAETVVERPLTNGCLLSTSCHCRKLLIRITQSSNLDLERAELHFVNYLHENGAPVTPPLQSFNKKMLEAVTEDGTDYAIAAFNLPTGFGQKPESWTHEMIVALGRAIGKIHALSAVYETPLPSWERPFSADLNRFVELDAKSKPEQTEEIESLKKILCQLGKDQNKFGLVHGNLCLENLAFNGDAVVVHGFENCCKSWFAFDIAKALHNAMKVCGIKNRAEYTDVFLEDFFHGYDEENELDGCQLDLIPVFLSVLVKMNGKSKNGVTSHTHKQPSSG